MAKKRKKNLRKKKRDGLRKRALRLFVKALTGFFCLSLLLVVLFRFMPVYVTPLMLIRCVEQLADGQKVRLKHKWVSIDSISKNMHLAVVSSEDQNFMNHFGFDFKAIGYSVKASVKGDKRLRGASTISQQTAKNVFLWPGRSWIRKGMEVYFTLLIELAWSKKRILEVYLNSIEMGKGVYGAEAASVYYFRSKANRLTKHQAAAIAAILPNPRKMSANPPSPYIRSRISWIMKQMGQLGSVKI